MRCTVTQLARESVGLFPPFVLHSNLVNNSCTQFARRCRTLPLFSICTWKNKYCLKDIGLGQSSNFSWDEPNSKNRPFWLLRWRDGGGVWVISGKKFPIPADWFQAGKNKSCREIPAIKWLCMSRKKKYITRGFRKKKSYSNQFTHTPSPHLKSQMVGP